MSYPENPEADYAPEPDYNVHKPIRWPEIGDKAFRPAKVPARGVPLVVGRFYREITVMSGFKLAGDELATLILGPQPHFFKLVYPMIFCYRHVIELGLKFLISQHGPAVGVSLPQLHQTHDLDRLWQTYRQISKPFEQAGDTEITDIIAEIVREFVLFDAKGIAFRYATDSKGALPSLPDFNIDIANIKDVMEGFYWFITSADSWLLSKTKS
jgi:hypothetical protein